MVSVRFKPSSQTRPPPGSVRKYQSSKRSYSATSHENHGYEASIDSSVTEKKINPLSSNPVDGKKFVEEENRRYQKTELKPKSANTMEDKRKANQQPRDQPDGRQDRKHYNQGRKSMISSDDLTSSSDYHSRSDGNGHDNRQRESQRRSRIDSSDRRDYQIKSYNTGRNRSHSASRGDQAYLEDEEDYDRIGYRNRTNRTSVRSSRPSHHSNGYDSDRQKRNDFHRSSSYHGKSRRDHSENYESEGEIRRSIRSRRSYREDRHGYESDGGTRRSLRNRRADQDNRRYNTEYESDSGRRHSVRSQRMDNKRRYRNHDSEDENHRSVPRTRYNDRNFIDYESDDRYLAGKPSHRKHHQLHGHDRYSDYESDYSRRSDRQHRRQSSRSRYDSDNEFRGQKSRRSTSQGHRSRSNSYRR